MTLWRDRYDEMLDECCEPVSVLGMTYPVSQVLAEVDPVAYRCGFADWISCAGLDCESCGAEVYPDVCMDDPVEPVLCDECEREGPSDA